MLHILCVHVFRSIYYISGELIVNKYVAESITMMAGRFGHKGILYAVDEGLRGRNVLPSLLLILLHICSRSVHPISTK